MPRPASSAAAASKNPVCHRNLFLEQPGVGFVVLVCATFSLAYRSERHAKCCSHGGAIAATVNKCIRLLHGQCSSKVSRGSDLPWHRSFSPGFTISKSSPLAAVSPSRHNDMPSAAVG